VILWVSACNFPFQSPQPEVEDLEPTAANEIKPTSPQFNLEAYSNEYYTFTYPQEYTITPPKPEFPVLTISKSNNKRMEIFQMSDIGDRPFGFSGDESQEEIDGYVPKERLTVGSGENEYDVWLYYSENDSQTREELKLIYDSIVITENN
jgi:hypothetical protein